MNGIGLLITILFCTIVWWGTANYYKAIIKQINKAHTQQLDAMAFEAERMMSR